MAVVTPPPPSVDELVPANRRAIRWLDGTTVATPLSASLAAGRQLSDDRVLPRSALLIGLSTALDLTEGQLPGHARRTTYLAMRIAEDLGLGPVDRENLFNATLLKDAGCSSNAAAVTQIFGADDIDLKRQQATTGRSTLAAAAFTLRNLPPEAGLTVNARRLVSLAVRGRRERRSLERVRCERGASIALKAGFSDAAAAAVHDVHEHWDGGGEPGGLRGEAINPLARIIAACAALDVFASTRGRAEGLDMLRRRRGTWYEPDATDALLEAASRGLLDELDAPDLATRVAQLEPAPAVASANRASIDRVASAFADIIDAKSPFTGSHSHGVADVAEALARSFGLPDAQIVDVQRAGLLHDLGKLGVPNRILDKPARLDAGEWDVIRRHPELTLRILSPIPTLQQVAELAACHHEQLDGRGYFRGLRDEALSIGARIIAVADVFEALTADRPYRAGLPIDRALAILAAESGDHLAADVVTALGPLVA